MFRALRPDGSPVEGFAFDGTRVTWNGSEPVDAGIRYELVLAGEPRWLVPGVFYGENRPEACVRVFPRFTPGRVDVARTTTNVLLLSGALAGLAGAVEVSGVTFALYENISPGYGYTAIAVALLAGLDSLGVLGTGILFGSLEAGALSMQREASVPSVVVTAVEAALVLLLLAISRRGSAAGIIARFAGARSPAQDDVP